MDKDLGVLLGAAEIPFHDHASRKPKFSGFPCLGLLPILPHQSGLQVGHGPAHAFGIRLRFLQLQGEAVHPAFGEAVPLLEADAFPAKGFPDRGRTRSPAGDGETHEGEIGLGEARGFQEHLEHGGYQEEEGGAVGQGEVQVLLGPETLLDHHAPAQVEEGSGQGVQGSVEHGGGYDVPIFPGKSPGEGGLDGVNQELAVGDQGSFGQAGGASGEEEEGGVFQPYPGGFLYFRPLEENLEGQGPRIQGLGDFLEALPIQERPGLGIGVKGLELGKAEAVVEGGEDVPEEGAGEEEVQVRRVVPGEKTHPVPFTHPQVPEGSGGPLRPLVKLGVGQPCPTEPDRLAPWMVGGKASQPVGLKHEALLPGGVPLPP